METKIGGGNQKMKENENKKKIKEDENKKNIKEKKIKENAKKTVETNGKLHNSKISVRNNSSVAFLNPTGFSGKHTVQKQIKDALKENLRRRPEKQFGSKKQKKGPHINGSGSPTKMTDVGFTGEKVVKNYIKGTLKKHMKEPSFPSQRPAIQTTRCYNILSTLRISNWDIFNTLFNSIEFYSDALQIHYEDYKKISPGKPRL